MLGYYGLREGTSFVYFPYHFAGMSLNGTSFRFRFDLAFLDKLAKSNLNLEVLAEKGWDIQTIDIPMMMLDSLMTLMYNGEFERALEKTYRIIEFCDDNLTLITNQYSKDEFYGLEELEDYLDSWWKNNDVPKFYKPEYWEKGESE